MTRRTNLNSPENLRRVEFEQNLQDAADALASDYEHDDELTIFTELDSEPFYDD